MLHRSRGRFPLESQCQERDFVLFGKSKNVGVTNSKEATEIGIGAVADGDPDDFRWCSV